GEVGRCCRGRAPICLRDSAARRADYHFMTARWAHLPYELLENPLRPLSGNDWGNHKLLGINGLKPFRL
ncbi:MAG: hypothetical protein ACI9GW_003328, partial [Halieaceae bacterium]